MENTTQRYSLNSKQIRILKLTFKFRFITPKLLATYLGVTRYAAYKSLQTLSEQDYLGFHYSSSYKLQGKAARYYLAKKSIALLRDEYEFDKDILKTMYKNKSVGQAFIDHHITVLEAYLHLNRCYPEVFNIFSRYELSDYDHFPEKLPDLYIRRRGFVDAEAKEYFLEVHDSIHSFVARKRLDSLIEFFDEDGWSESRYPTLLFVLPDSRNERRFQEYAANKLDSAGIEDELRVLISSVKAIGSDDVEVWTDVLKPEAAIPLT